MKNWSQQTEHHIPAETTSVVALPHDWSSTMTFEEAFLPHHDAAYNLARWLTRDEAEAQDLVQEAYLRALKFFNRFHGTEGRPWLLTIVRNTFYTWRRNRSMERSSYDFDEALDVCESDEPDPETAQIIKSQKQLLNEAINRLAIEFREVIVLRELEELSYKEIADVTGIPIGTVMSRLARARKKLQLLLRNPRPENASIKIETIGAAGEGIKEETFSI